MKRICLIFLFAALLLTAVLADTRDSVSVTVNSNPSGTKIYLNGIDTGFTTPHTFQINSGTTVDLSVANHDVLGGGIMIYTPGNHTLINVNQSTTINFTGEYVAIGKRFRAESVPSGAEIWFNEIDSGFLTPQLLMLDNMAVTDISVHKDGYSFLPPVFSVSGATEDTLKLFVAQEIIPHPAENPLPPDNFTSLSWVFPLQRDLAWSPPSTGIAPSGYDLYWNGSETPVDLGNVLSTTVPIPAIGDYVWKIVPYYLYVYPDPLGSRDYTKGPNSGDVHKACPEACPSWAEQEREQKPPAPERPTPGDRARRRAERQAELEWNYPPGYASSCPRGCRVEWKELLVPEETDTLATFTQDPGQMMSPPLLPATTYFWRVVPYNTAGEADSCAIWQFSTYPLPIPLSPVEQINVTPTHARLTFDVPDYPVDSFFDIYLSIDPDFPEPPVYSGTGVIDPLLPAQRYWDAPVLLSNETYFWAVCIDPPYDPDYAAGSYFTTGDYPPPETPVLIAPDYSQANVIPENIKLEWSADKNFPDSFFDVYFDTNPTFPNPPVYTGPAIAELLDPTRFHIEIENAIIDTTYYWCVKLTDVLSGQNAISPPWWFTTPPAFRPGFPEVVIPPPEVVLPPVTFKNNASADHNIYYKTELMEYAWTFGDATPPPNHEYLPPSRGFTAACTVTDSDGDANLEVDVPEGIWWILSFFNGTWHTGSPYPYMEPYPGTVLLPPVPLGEKGITEFYVLLMEGPNNDPTLPVELSSFNAACTAQNFVSLDWVVQSETNILGYNILRSENEILEDAQVLNLIPISDGTALGTQISYNYLDDEVESNNTYNYWLQSLELNGLDHFFGPVSVTVTGGGQDPNLPDIPTSTTLLAAYPNPFNPHTKLSYKLKEAGNVTIDVFNNKGQIIRRFSNSHNSGGYYHFSWDGKDTKGIPASSGVYYYRMNCGEFSATRKLVLIK